MSKRKAAGLKMPFFKHPSNLCNYTSCKDVVFVTIMLFPPTSNLMCTVHVLSVQFYAILPLVLQNSVIQHAK